MLQKTRILYDDVLRLFFMVFVMETKRQQHSIVLMKIFTLELLFKKVEHADIIHNETLCS